MRSRQAGLTLVEVSIVVIVVGLLFGSVLMGHALLDASKAKNLAADFRAVPGYLNAYRDVYRALPGDDAGVGTRLPGSAPASTPAGRRGDGRIDGGWNSTLATDESRLFWQHVRLAGMATGATDPADPLYAPQNAVGGALGISGTLDDQLQIAGLVGQHQVCSSGIAGKFARRIDTIIDDGNTAAGAVRAVPDGSGARSTPTATVDLEDARLYTVCMAL